MICFKDSKPYEKYVMCKLTSLIFQQQEEIASYLHIPNLKVKEK